MKKYDAVVYEDEGRFAVIVYGSSDRPKNINPIFYLIIQPPIILIPKMIKNHLHRKIDVRLTDCALSEIGSVEYTFSG